MENWKWIGGLLLAGLLLARPEAAALGASQAMAQWCAAVAPALFPFLALMPLLTCETAARAYERLLGSVTRRLFRLPGAAASAMAVGMIAGTPAGAVAGRRIAANSGMNAGQLARVSAAFAGFSPAFLVSGVGVGMLGSAGLGWRLFGAQALTQLTMALLLRNAWADRTELVRPLAGSAGEAPVRAAVLTALGIGGYMTLFGAMSFAVAGLLGSSTANALLCLLDVPSGARLLAGLGGIGERARFALLSAACGFGGACLAAQNLGALKGCGVDAVEYVALRVLAAAICAMYAALLWALPDGLPPLALGLSGEKALAIAGLSVALLALPALLKMRKSIS